MNLFAAIESLIPTEKSSDALHSGATNVTPNLRAQRAYYDTRWRWPSTEFANPLQLERAIAVLQGVRQIRQRQPRILDAGCGTGWLTGMLACFGETTGIDLSPIGIRAARKRFPAVPFHVGDLMSVELPEESFDIVVSVQVIDHMQDQAAFVNRLWRWTKPGGYLILITTNANNMRHWNPAALQDFSNGLQPIENWLTPRSLRRLLKQRFKVQHLTTLLPGYGRRGTYRLLHSFKLDRLLQRVGLQNAYNRLLLRMGCGLVIYAMARRPL